MLFISYPEPWPGAYPAWQDAADQLMAAAQADPSIDFIVTYGHRPAYSSVESDIDPDLRTAIDNLAVKYSPTAAIPAASTCSTSTTTCTGKRSSSRSTGW